MSQADESGTGVYAVLYRDRDILKAQYKWGIKACYGIPTFYNSYFALSYRETDQCTNK